MKRNTSVTALLRAHTDSLADTLENQKRLEATVAPNANTSKTLTLKTMKSSAATMNTREEIEHITEMMHKHEDNAVLLSQLQAMLNDARQRLRRQQYKDYFINRK